MSNYYYEEKPRYLATLADVAAAQHDLTPFVTFALRGVALQVNRVLSEIQRHISKELFRTLMYDLFGRLRTPKKRVIAKRQLEILKLLLSEESMTLSDVITHTDAAYAPLT